MDDQEEEGDVPKSAVSFSTNGSGTSSEEEHREDAAEIAAIVEELVPDEDPVHISSDDMKLLIEKVKRFTTISNVGEDDWNDDVCEVIHQFFSHRKNKLLAVYFNKKTLEARLDIPKIAVTDIMVFLKDPADEITPENFHDTIKFTTCSGMVEGTILSLTQYIYTPALFKSKSLPEGTRDEFLLKMYSFLSDLTDINSKLQGYTSIYVPIGALSYSIDQGSENKDLIKRLESMLVSWTRQIRVTLGDIVVTGTKDDRYPTDEYDFWVYRYQVVAALEYQLKNKDLRHIISILCAAQSTFVQQYFNLQDDIQEAMKQAKSNIEFLQILNDPCRELKKLKRPPEISSSLPYLIYLIHIIWTNSPYYNTKEQVAGLFRNLSNLVILQCKNSVALASILQGNAIEGIRQFEACILCLQKYKAYYTKISEALYERDGRPWDMDKGFIFNHVDSFITRCREMIEVCEAMVVFGRSNEFTSGYGDTVRNRVKKFIDTFANTVRGTEVLLLFVEG